MKDKKLKQPLFFLRTFNDIDHIVPIIWKCCKKGYNPYIIFMDNYDYKNDYRIKFLTDNCSLHIYYLPSLCKSGLFFKVFRKIFLRPFLVKIFLTRRNICSCVYEWRSPGDAFFYAAKSLNIPTFCVPHGCNIYLNYDINPYIRNIYDETGSWPDFSRRSKFDYYIVQSQYHKKLCTDWGISPEVMGAWGSARYYPEWVKLNLKICQEFKPEKDDKNKLRTIFILPHWSYNVNKAACLRLLDKLGDLPWIYLIIKDHTRGTGRLPDNYRARYNALPNVEASVSAHSPALIRWSDIVISFGSSIGIEALLQDKILLDPEYLHTNTTVFNDTRSDVILDNEEKVLEVIAKIKEGNKMEVPQENKEKLFREVVYGGEAPFNVLEKYCRHILGNVESREVKG